MSKKQAATEILNRLNRLGSADAIAYTLLAAGAYGQPEDNYYCPLAHYLHQEVGGHWSVGLHWVTRRWSLLRWFSVGSIRLGYHLRTFVLEFDQGAYDELSEIRLSRELRDYLFMANTNVQSNFVIEPATVVLRDVRREHWEHQRDLIDA